MAKVTFITFYDQQSPGLRIMSSCLCSAGHRCNTIYFKLAYSHPIESPNDQPVSGEVFKDWQLLEYARSEAPWSPAEVDLLIQRLEKDDPDIIGISNRSPLDRQCLPVLNRIKRRFPDKCLVAGGWGPLLAPGLYLRQVDFVVFGEGEGPILDLADALDRGANLDRIDNLVYMQNARMVRNPVRAPVANLDVYPLPDFANPGNCFIENDRITDRDPASGFDPAKDTYSLLIGRGCVRRCSYCSEGQWKTLYQEFGGWPIRPHRVRSVDHILAECQMAKRLGYRYISILESHLTGSRAYLLDFFRRYQKQIGLPFTAYLHPHQIAAHPELLDAACEAGFRKGPIGVQHGSDRFCREFFNRNVPNDLILQIAEMFDERGINIEYQLIAGIPFETEETLGESFDFVARLPMAHGFLTVSRLKVFPKSPLEQLIRERNFNATCHPNDWYFAALLYNFRTIFKNPLFGRVRAMTTEFSRRRSTSVTDMMGAYYEKLAGLLAEEKIVLHGPRALVEKIYPARTEDKGGFHG